MQGKEEQSLGLLCPRDHDAIYQVKLISADIVVGKRRFEWPLVRKALYI